MTIVEQHALKHGLSSDEVEYAWESLVRCQLRVSDDWPPRWIGLGVLPDGRIAQMVAIEDAQGNWRVFHAMTPPTKSFMRELGIESRKMR